MILEEIVKKQATEEKHTRRTSRAEGGAFAPVSTANVSNPPTDAELDSAFGTPSAVGAGFWSILDDNGDDTNVYLVFSNGTSWYYAGLTKAA